MDLFVSPYEWGVRKQLLVQARLDTGKVGSSRKVKTGGGTTEPKIVSFIGKSGGQRYGNEGLGENDVCLSLLDPTVDRDGKGSEGLTVADKMMVSGL